MRRSLERHLSRMLGGTIVLAGFLAGAISFWLAYGEAQEFQDDTLRQIAAMASKDLLNGQANAEFGAVSAGIDPEARVMLLRLPSTARTPSWLPSELPPGFHTVDGRDGGWRLFVRRTGDAGIVVAQATEARNEIAIHSALRTLVPLLALFPLLVWLAARIVRSELLSVRHLAQVVDAQPAENPAFLPDAGIPEEILPFIRSINRLLERVGQLVTEQRRFIADAAHELRTPLTALSLQMQNLEKADTLEAVRDRIVPLKQGIERGRRLVEQLLSHARSQVGALGREAVDLSKMGRELIAGYQPLAEAKNLDIGLESAEGIVLRTDPQMLLLVLRNALDNALRYTPPGGEVTLRMYREEDSVVVEVIDSGPGIPASERERVFDPFHRIAGDESEGSGLGLAIARDAAMRLGGLVSLHDRNGGPGLVFRYRQRLSP